MQGCATFQWYHCRNCKERLLWTATAGDQFVDGEDHRGLQTQPKYILNTKTCGLSMFSSENSL